jgi:hypothetical protein
MHTYIMVFLLCCNYHVLVLLLDCSMPSHSPGLSAPPVAADFSHSSQPMHSLSTSTYPCSLVLKCAAW